MEKNFYPMVAAGFIVLTMLCLALIVAGAYTTFRRMGLSLAETRKRTLILATILLLWTAIVSVFSLQGVLSDFEARPPKLFLVLLLPFVAIVVLLTRPSFRHFLLHVPPSWLLYLQVFRVPVELFLWLLFVDGLAPVQMTFEGRNLDVLTGLTAPVAAFLCFGQGRNLTKLAALWNLLGFALLLNIVITAILSMPTPFRVFMNEPANTIVTQFPVVFLPAILVPLAYSLHFFSLLQLYLKRQADTHAPLPTAGTFNQPFNS